MSPIRNAMRLIDDKHPDAALDERKKFLKELRIGEAFGRDHEYVHFVGLERGLDSGPFGNVFAMDGHGANAKFFSGEDLVAHEREQRADEQRWTGARVAQDFCGEEIDDAFAPAGALDDENSLALVCGEIDGFPLAV